MRTSAISSGTIYELGRRLDDGDPLTAAFGAFSSDPLGYWVGLGILVDAQRAGVEHLSTMFEGILCGQALAAIRAGEERGDLVQALFEASRLQRDYETPVRAADQL